MYQGHHVQFSHYHMVFSQSLVYVWRIFTHSFMEMIRPYPTRATFFHVSSSIIWSYLAHFLSPSSKSKKNPRPKKFLIFQEMELSGSNIKKLKGTETPKKILTFQETDSLKKLLIFWEIELLSPSSINKKYPP